MKVISHELFTIVLQLVIESSILTPQKNLCCKKGHFQETTNHSNKTLYESKNKWLVTDISPEQLMLMQLY